MTFFQKIFKTSPEEITNNNEIMTYVGVWKSRYGSYIKITPKGKADCEKIVWEGDKTSTRSIQGGDVNYDNGVISIHQMGIKQEFRVDKAPYSENGNVYVVLDDVAYSKIA